MQTYVFAQLLFRLLEDEAPACTTSTSCSRHFLSNQAHIRVSSSSCSGINRPRGSHRGGIFLSCLRISRNRVAQIIFWSTRYQVSYRFSSHCRSAVKHPGNFAGPGLYPPPLRAALRSRSIVPCSGFAAHMRTRLPVRQIARDCIIVKQYFTPCLAGAAYQGVSQQRRGAPVGSERWFSMSRPHPFAEENSTILEVLQRSPSLPYPHIPLHPHK